MYKKELHNLVRFQASLIGSTHANLWKRVPASYGHFTGAKEFWSQCHIFRFCKHNIVQKNRSGATGRLSADPPPLKSRLPDPRPPHPPRGEHKTGTLRMRFGKKNVLIEIKIKNNFKVSPRSPKCNFLIRPCKPKWIERKKYETLSRCSKNFERDTYKGGRGALAPRPPL